MLKPVQIIPPPDTPDAKPVEGLLNTEEISTVEQVDSAGYPPDTMLVTMQNKDEFLVTGKPADLIP